MKQLCKYAYKTDYKHEYGGYVRKIEYYKYFIYDNETKTVTRLNDEIAPLGLFNSNGYCLFHYKDWRHYGIIDDTGAVILPPKYKKIHGINGNTAIVEGDNGLFGLIDCYGNVLLPVIYISLSFTDNLASIKAETEENYFEYNLLGVQLTKDYKVSVSQASSGLYGIVRKDTSEFIVEPEYNSILSMESFNCPVFISEKNGKYGLFDLRGVLIYDCLFDYIGFDEDYQGLCFRIGDRSGYFNRSNEAIYQGQYGKYELFHSKEGIGIRLFHNKRVLVYPNKNRKISFINHNLFLVSELPVGEREWVYGVIDDKGNNITPLNGIKIRYTTTGHIIYYDSEYSKPSLYNKKGDLLIKEKYDRIGLTDWKHDVEEPLFYNSYLIVSNHVKYDNEVGLVDLLGKEVVPPKYSRIRPLPTIEGFLLNGSIIVNKHFSITCRLPSGYYVDDELLNKDGVAVFRKYSSDETTCGLVTIAGKTSFLPGPFFYAYAHNNRLVVYDNTKGYGYSDLEGNIIIPFRYNAAGSFEDGKARVRYDTEYGYINTLGELILNEDKDLRVPAKYDWGWLYEDEIIVARGGKYGCIDKDHNIILPISFSKNTVTSCIYYFKHRQVFKHTFLRPFIDNGSGLFGIKDDQGALILPAIFEEIKGVQKRDNYHDVRNPIDKAIESDLIPVKFNTLWGYINKQGETVIPFVFTEVDFFSEGLAAVEVAPQFQKQMQLSHGFINEKGEVVISLNYKAKIVSGFSNGTAWVEINPCTPGKDNYDLQINKRDLFYGSISVRK